MYIYFNNKHVYPIAHIYYIECIKLSYRLNCGASGATYHYYSTLNYLCSSGYERKETLSFGTKAYKLKLLFY